MSELEMNLDLLISIQPSEFNNNRASVAIVTISQSVKTYYNLYLLCAAYTEYGVECIAMPKASTTATPNANHQLHH